MTKIKICGLMHDCDVDFVNEALPDYAGFVFAPTRREISVKDARRFREKLAVGITAVGVFVDKEPEQVAWLLGEGIIQMAQLHGQEDAAYVEWLKIRTGCPVIKALHPERGTGMALYGDYVKAGVDYFLFDCIPETSRKPYAGCRLTGWTSAAAWKRTAEKTGIKYWKS